MMYKIIFTVFGAIASIYVLACLALMRWQNRFIFFPSSTLTLAPEALGLPYEEVWLEIPNSKTDQPEQLHGWWLPTSSPKLGTLLYLHGNGSNIAGNLEHAYRFVQLGYDVFVFDYRGYGRSEGNFPNETRVYEDAQTALDNLLQQRAIASQEIIVYGHSLGGAIAIDLAAKNPNLGGLIIEASFTSMRDMVDLAGIYSIFPINLLLDHHFDSIDKIPSLTMPILYTHGTADRTIPAFMSQQLFDATQSPKRLFLVPGADHNNIATTSGDAYLQTIREFDRLRQNHRGQLTESL